MIVRPYQLTLHKMDTSRVIIEDEYGDAIGLHIRDLSDLILLLIDYEVKYG